MHIQSTFQIIFANSSLLFTIQKYLKNILPSANCFKCDYVDKNISIKNSYLWSVN